MKQFLSSVFVSLICFSANAQLNGQASNIKIYRDSVMIPHNFNAFAFNRPEYKFLFKNNKGSVYESPVDKMRVLVPEFYSHMPVLPADVHSHMPVKKLYPEGLNLSNDRIKQLNHLQIPKYK